jgi:hypothetical protein
MFVGERKTYTSSTPEGCLAALRAFSGEVDAGSPPENAITQREIERIPILLERNFL